VRNVSTPKQETVPEPPDVLDKELRERLKTLAKSVKELSDLVEKASRDIEETRKKLSGGK